MRNATITSIASVLPTDIITSNDIENLITKNSRFSPQENIIETITGIKTRHVSNINEYNSTLAAQACEKLFSSYADIKREDIDLLIFASAGQDILEPATAHIVQDAINTSCPVMDVTNACNSFINALEISNAFIQNGNYTKILIATGEVSSKSAQFEIKNRSDFKKNFPGYTFGDVGTAVVVEATKSPRGILDMSFEADSSHWDTAMFRGGGSRHPHEAGMHFEGNGAQLKTIFSSIAPPFVNKFLKKNNRTPKDIQHVFVHQVSLPYHNSFKKTCNFNDIQVEKTISKYGNVAAASLPLAWSLRDNKKQISPNDIILLIGLAGGISVGAALIRA